MTYSFRRIFTVAVLGPALLLSIPVHGQDAQDEESAIRARAEGYVEAFNQGDAGALAGFWAKDATWTDPRSGEIVAGREKIRDGFAALLKANEGARLELVPLQTLEERGDVRCVPAELVVHGLLPADCRRRAVRQRVTSEVPDAPDPEGVAAAPREKRGPTGLPAKNSCQIARPMSRIRILRPNSGLPGNALKPPPSGKSTWWPACGACAIPST